MQPTVVLTLLLVGCADTSEVTPAPVVPPPPPPILPQIRSIAIRPARFGVAAGQPVQLEADVDADSGVSKAVVWRSALATAVSVTQTGLVTAAPCLSSGSVSIEAIAVADTTKRGTADAGVGDRYHESFPTIDALQDSVTGRDLPLAAIRGTVRVSIRSFVPGCPVPADSVRLRVTGQGVDTAFATIPLTTAPPYVTYWPSALRRNDQPVFPTGQYTLRAEALVIGKPFPIPGGSIPLNVVNP